MGKSQDQKNYESIQSGFGNFANTGGFSTDDIQNMRARATSPVTAAYGNTMMNLDRARRLGGVGGAPNYIAAVSKAQRELPQQMSDAMTGINSNLAQMIAQNKLSGLQGQTQAYGANQGAHGQGIGSTLMGLGGSFLGGFLSDRTKKKNITEVKMPITEGLRKLRVFNWEYKGDNTKHIGPMAQDFKDIFGVGDGKTLHPADIFGVIIGAEKERVNG